jgi:serine/threonine protein kinase
MHGIQEETHLQELVRDTIRRWRMGARPDADEFLRSHPELSRHKSLAIDLIYEEYCLRHEQGDTLVPSTFCERFPHYEQSLSKMLAVHETLEGSSPRAQPPQSPWPKVGDSFLGYHLVEALGRGSLARVFLAREAAVGSRLVVVKISRHGAGEAHLLGKAAHPAIVPILSVTHDDDTGWTVICMPLLGTATAADLLKAAFSEGRLPRSAEIVAQVSSQFCPAGVTPEGAAHLERQAWRGPYADGIARLGLLLAEGLEAAHGAGIMHRDIKPSNVLLGWSGRPMLLDFNLSTEIGLSSERVGGTLAYMAPELMTPRKADASAAALQFDRRADIFSLGALLYELLTGRLPAKPAGAEDLAPNDVAPWLAARRQAVVPPRQIDPQIDPCLETIVLRCLAVDPQGRFSSAGDLASALRRYLGWGARRWRELRRRRRQILAGALGAAALAVAGGVYVSRLPPLEERLFAQGMREYEAGQFAAAEQTFARCIKMRPAWPEARFARGQALRMAGDAGAARTEFLALQDYSVALAYSMAGYCDLVVGNHVAAENDYSLAIQEGADDATTWNNVGLCQKRHGRHAQAILYFNKSLALNPDLAVARCNRALSSFQQSLAAQEPLENQTVEDILKACELEPERADFHFHAASILSLADPALIDTAFDHLKQAFDLGYPRQTKGLAAGLKDRLAAEQSEGATPRPLSRNYQPEPLFASPSTTAVLDRFLSP